MKIESKNWKKLLNESPKRWVGVYKNDDKSIDNLMEVHDLDSGIIWINIGNDRWMHMGA